MNPNVFIPTKVTMGNQSIDLKISISIDDLLRASGLPEQPKPPVVMGRPRLLSKEDERLLDALFESGVQPEGIAEAFGISRASCYRYAQRYKQRAD